MTEMLSKEAILAYAKVLSLQSRGQNEKTWLICNPSVSGMQVWSFALCIHRPAWYRLCHTSHIVTQLELNLQFNRVSLPGVLRDSPI